MFEFLFSALSFVFYPLSLVKPVVALLVISAFITILINLINRFLVNQTLVKQLKKRMEEIREDISKAQKSGDNERANRFVNEMLEINNQYMKQMFKALTVSIVVILLFLPWVQFKYGSVAVARLPMAMPYIGNEVNWFLWYAIVSLAIGWTMRKLLGLEYA
jgi:uncharacterized membrane protein (DUF106 family)